MREGEGIEEDDVLVVGGGAAGLSAALVLLRARRTVVLVDAGAPRNAPAAHMHGFLSRDGMPPRDLLAAGRSEVSGYGGSLLDDTVVGVEPGFHVRLADASPLRARRILVATGLRDDCQTFPACLLTISGSRPVDQLADAVGSARDESPEHGGCQQAAVARQPSHVDRPHERASTRG